MSEGTFYQHAPTREELLDADSYQRELLRRRLRWDPQCPGSGLFHFCKVGMGMVDMEWEVHGKICTILEMMYFGQSKPGWINGHIVNLVNLQPRGHLKTSIVTIGFPSWVLHLDDPPRMDKVSKPVWAHPRTFNGKMGFDQRFLLAGETREKVKEFMGPIKRHMEENDFLRDLFGDMVPDDKKKTPWTNFRLSVPHNSALTAKEANINSTSLDSSKVGTHVDIFIGDDLVTSETVRSDEMIQKSIEFVEGLSPILDPPQALRIMNGTRWHDADLYGHWIDRVDRGEVNALIYIERMERTAEEIAKGKRPIYWPERFTQDVIDGLYRENPSYFVSAQYNNEIIPQATAPFKKEYFEGMEFKFDSERDAQWLKTCNTFTTIDPAISKDKKACFAVVMTCAWDSEGHCWLLDMFREKEVLPDALLQEVFRQNRVWKPRVVGLETRGFQIIYEYNAMAMSRKTGEYPPFEPLKESGRSKEERVYAMEPLCAQRRFHWQRKHEALVKELMRFPHGKYRDAADAFAYQKDIAFPGRGMPDAIPQHDTPDGKRLDILKAHQKKLATLGIDVYKRKVNSWLEV